MKKPTPTEIAQERYARELWNDSMRHLGHMLLAIYQAGWSLDLNAPGEVTTQWAGRLQPPPGSEECPILAFGDGPEVVAFGLSSQWVEQQRYMAAETEG